MTASEVQLLWAPLRDLAPQPAHLSAAERERWHRMAPGPGIRWAAGRTWVRERLAERLGCSPATVPLGSESSGRPILLDGAAHLSISHTERVIALAISPDPIGIDVEAPPPAGEDLIGLAQLVGSAAEVGELSAVPLPERPAAFQRWWVAKEAVLKAIGTGFLTDARHLHVGVAAPRAPHPLYLHEIGALLDGEICAATTSTNRSVVSVTTP